MNSPTPKKRWTKSPLLELFSSMRFAVALLTVVAIAAVIGTVIPQNRPPQDYVAAFGLFWSRIFDFLGLFDVYSSLWFVFILFFLAFSTALCLFRNVPNFLKETRSFRPHANLDNISYKHTFSGSLKTAIAERYLQVKGFKTQHTQREDGILIAAKKGSINKFGYIFAHIALIIICFGGLIDSNFSLKLGILSGLIEPSATAQYESEFTGKSRLSADRMSFRGDVNLPEKQTAGAIFLNTGNNTFVLQELPFTVRLDGFHIDYYDNGMPKEYSSDITVTDKKTGQIQTARVQVNHPFKTHGAAIYQASFGDGGSSLEFDIWALPSIESKANTLKARALSNIEIPFVDDKLKFSFTDFKSVNVVNGEDGEKQNLGPTITYETTALAGERHIFTNFMFPQQRNGVDYYFYGSRRPDESEFHWLAIPTDSQGSLKTFMQLRSMLLDPKQINKISQKLADIAPKNEREKTARFVQNTLSLFAQGGYTAVDDFITKQIPANEQNKLGTWLYQTVAYAAGNMLNEILAHEPQPEWKDEQREKFVIDSLQAFTGLKYYPQPLLLQLKDYEEIKASGLQITRSPGERWVYLGSLFLTLGSIFMLYIKERRAWILINNNDIKFAMTAGRHKNELASEFDKYKQEIQILIDEKIESL